MNFVNNLFYYLKYITFIMFLCAAIAIYPGLISLKMGICLLVLLIIYSVVSFIMFFIKRPGEQFNVLNNIVLCFLHIYFCFIAYKYQSISGTLGDINDSYFSLNYFVTSLCLFTLTINKFILSDNK